MKKTVKSIALVVVASMVLSSVACTSDSSPAEPSAPPATAAPASTTAPAANTPAAATATAAPTATVAPTPEGPANLEPVTLTYWYPMHVSDTPELFENNLGYPIVTERTGVSIEWQLAPATGTDETFNLLMASGNLPDIVCRNVPGLQRYFQAFQPIDEVIRDNPRYANLQEYLLDDDYLDLYLRNSDGKLRIVPCLATRRIGDIIMLRKDKLEEWNMEVPVTIDDWHALFVKAKEEGMIPYMTRQNRAGLFHRLLDGYLDGAKENYYEENGVIKYGVRDEPRFKEAVELMRDWYAEGLIDPTYPTTDATIWWEEVLRGNVFATHDNIMRINSANEDYIENQNVDYRMMGIAPMQSPVTNKQITTIHYPRVRDKSASISVSSKHLERALDFFDFFFSEEGYILGSFGIEGVSFEYNEDGMPQSIPTYGPAVTAGEMLPLGTTRDQPKNQSDELIYEYNEPDNESHQLVREARDMYAANDNAMIRENWIASLSFGDEDNQVRIPLVAELDTYRNEWLDKFIMGVEPMEKWDEFIDGLGSLGLDQTIEIYQRALDVVMKNE